ncbi:putative TNF receptor-associated factor 6 [Paratrimastix pyriformis]|uniref:TNF receptor-associated factor 6 n=1 Tax=Paratrimastix pyriformis TaxID=342808 RepID=A0ABQ8UJT3_9EUKA|nr:putative TNF receptor-associated factor 6 [Paratrimastix pyriformis]
MTPSGPRARGRARGVRCCLWRLSVLSQVSHSLRLFHARVGRRAVWYPCAGNGQPPVEGFTLQVRVMEVGGGSSNNDSPHPCCHKKRAPCRPRIQLEYVASVRDDDETWRCPACLAHYEDPVCLSCGDMVCRTCATVVGDICPACSERFIGDQLCPSRMAQRQVARLQCHCPNRGLGCEAVVGVLDVERHLQAECEWRAEECHQCHQQVPRAEMARHKDTTCAHRPMACGYADVGCETRCAQEDLAAHERDGVVAHVGLLRQCLASTSLELAQTRHDLAQTKAQLARCQEQLAQTAEQSKQELTAVRAQIDQLFIPPAAPEGLAARWDAATMDVALDWRPVPPGPPVRYQVQATLVVAGGYLSPAVVYTGPECRCRYRFPPDAAPAGAVARFVVVAMRGLAESGPSAPAKCTRPVGFSRTVWV